MRALAPSSALASTGIIVVSLTTLALGACRGEPAPSVVSEAPATFEGSNETLTAPQTGRLGIRARVAYADLETIALAALPERRTERGSRRVCKRVLGVPLCGTAHWDVLLSRTGAPTIAAVDGERVAVTLPLRIDGTVGLDGRVARALSLDVLSLHGAARATARLAFDLDERWCPRLAVELEHVWTERPSLGWAAGLDVDLAGRLDARIEEELERLPARLEEAIDCERFRERLGAFWRTHHVPLSLPDAPDVWLDIAPTGFAFSGVRAGPDALGVGFALQATTLVQGAPSPDVSRPLPPLERVPYAPGRTRFDLLFRADYALLDALAAPALVGRTFRSDTAAGEVGVDVTSIAFSGNPDGITVSLGFTADLPATRRPTRGHLYLTARPVVDAVAERISLTDIRLSRVIDDRLWQLIGSVFETQIIGVIERRAVLDLTERARTIERTIVAQLGEPSRTGGLAVEARDVDVRLLALVPERDALAAVARVEATLDIDVPLAVLERPFRADPTLPAPER